MSKAKQALIAAEKAQKAFANKQMTDYLGIPEIKEKAWHELAVEHGADFTVDMASELKKYNKKICKAIKCGNIWSKEAIKEQNGKQKVEKAATDDYLDSEYNRVVNLEIVDILAVMEAEFVDILKNIYINRMETLSLQATDALLKDMGIKIDFNKVSKAALKRLKVKVIQWADQVNKTTQKAVKRVLVDGFTKGLGEMDIAKLIEQNTDFTYARAESIARTETVEAANFGEQLSYELNDDIISKQWVTAQDDRVRSTHRAANKQIVPKNEPFIVGSSKLMYPGDGSFGALAKEIIMCRCVMIPIFKQKGDKS